MGGSTQHELPRYPQLLKAPCWICKKLVAWMEVTHPMLFKKWRGLPMTFVWKQSAVAIRDGPGHLLPCEMVAMPLFRGEVIDSDDECVINLDFMSEGGKMYFQIKGLSWDKSKGLICRGQNSVAQ
jgi:hypothetical protein